MTLPLAVSLRGRRVVVVGGGPVAAAKLAPLVDEGADVVVIAPEAVESATRAATWVQRRYRGAEDLRGAWLVVAATGVAEVDDAVVADADAAGIWSVRSGAGDSDGAASFMAKVERGPMVIAVASGAPALSRHMRAEIDSTFGAEYADLARLYVELRQDPDVQRRLHRMTPDERRSAWRSIPAADILGLLRQGEFVAAKKLAFSCLS